MPQIPSKYYLIVILGAFGFLQHYYGFGFKELGFLLATLAIGRSVVGIIHNTERRVLAKTNDPTVESAAVLEQAHSHHQL